MADAFDPGARRTYFLTDDERIVRPDGPALVGPDGRRLDLPPRAFEALNHVLQALREGLGSRSIHTRRFCHSPRPPT
jgi:hypothetical protein